MAGLKKRLAAVLIGLCLAGFGLWQWREKAGSKPRPKAWNASGGWPSKSIRFWSSGEPSMPLSPTAGRPPANVPARRPGTTPLFRNFLLLLCLLPCGLGAGCSAVKVIEPPALPRALLLPTPIPEWNGATIGDLVEYAQDLETALEAANADKAALLSLTEDTGMGTN